MVNECTLSNGKLPQGGLPWNNVVRRKSLHIQTTVRATKSGRDLPLERKSLLSKTGDRYF